MYQRGFHWMGFHETSYWGLYTKISQETPNLVTIRLKYFALYVCKDLSAFHIVGSNVTQQ
jgi:hypothetical protein